MCMCLFVYVGGCRYVFTCDVGMNKLISFINIIKAKHNQQFILISAKISIIYFSLNSNNFLDRKIK